MFWHIYLTLPTKTIDTHSYFTDTGDAYIGRWIGASLFHSMAYTFFPRHYKRLQWRHNDSDGVSNHRLLDCLLNPCSCSHQRKHQISVSLASVRGIHRWPVDSPRKRPVKRKRFHLMTPSWWLVEKWSFNEHNSLNLNQDKKSCIQQNAFEMCCTIFHPICPGAFMYSYI